MPTKTDIIEFLAREFPQNPCIVDAVAVNKATIHRVVGGADLRPGNTVSGPVLMATADVAMYVALLATIGLVPLAVTTSFNMNFLRRPTAHVPIVARCRLLKVGRTLAVGAIDVYSDAVVVAHATATYSIPPQKP